MSELNAEVWRNLLRLTTENLSSDMLRAIMQDMLNRPSDDIFALSHDQASRLVEVLGPLANLRKILWDQAANVSDPEMADKIVTAQLDQLAVGLVSQADLGLFPKR